MYILYQIHTGIPGRVDQTWSCPLRFCGSLRFPNSHCHWFGLWLGNGSWIIFPDTCVSAGSKHTHYDTITTLQVMTELVLLLHTLMKGAWWYAIPNMPNERTMEAYPYGDGPCFGLTWYLKHVDSVHAVGIMGVHKLLAFSVRIFIICSRK